MASNSHLSRILTKYPRIARAFTFPRINHIYDRTANYAHNHYVRLGLTVVSVAAMAHLIGTHVLQVVPASGPSMLPTFYAYGDWIVVDMRCSSGRGIQVGDIVVYKIPVKRYDMGVKRIIGMPGDYVSAGTPGEVGEDIMVQVPKGHCWIVGDNLSASRDSRTFGPLPLALVRGKVIAKLFPWEERRWVTNEYNEPVEVEE